MEKSSKKDYKNHIKRINVIFKQPLTVNELEEYKNLRPARFWGTFNGEQKNVEQENLQIFYFPDVMEFFCFVNKHGFYFSHLPDKVHGFKTVKGVFFREPQNVLLPPFHLSQNKKISKNLNYEAQQQEENQEQMSISTEKPSKLLQVSQMLENVQKNTFDFNIEEEKQEEEEKNSSNAVLLKNLCPKCSQPSKGLTTSKPGKKPRYIRYCEFHDSEYRIQNNKKKIGTKYKKNSQHISSEILFISLIILIFLGDDDDNQKKRILGYFNHNTIIFSFIRPL